MKQLINKRLVKRDTELLTMFLSVLAFLGFDKNKTVVKWATRFADTFIEHRSKKWVN